KPKSGKGKKAKDDDGDAKKKGGKKKLSPVIVGSLAVGAILALGIGGYVMFGGKDNKPKQMKPGPAIQPPPGGGTVDSTKPNPDGSGTTATTKPGPVDTSKVGNPTNLLPADTQGV